MRSTGPQELEPAPNRQLAELVLRAEPAGET